MLVHVIILRVRPEYSLGWVNIKTSEEKNRGRYRERDRGEQVNLHDVITNMVAIVDLLIVWQMFNVYTKNDYLDRCHVCLMSTETFTVCIKMSGLFY
jgi:hypothetical protein